VLLRPDFRATLSNPVSFVTVAMVIGCAMLLFSTGHTLLRKWQMIVKPFGYQLDAGPEVEEALNRLVPKVGALRGSQPGERVNGVQALRDRAQAAVDAVCAENRRMNLVVLSDQLNLTTEQLLDRESKKKAEKDADAGLSAAVEKLMHHEMQRDEVFGEVATAHEIEEEVEEPPELADVTSEHADAIEDWARDNDLIEQEEE
jgi:hypothetical protein